VSRDAEALVIALLRREPRDRLHRELRGRVESHLVGDAATARPTVKVILEAAVLGRRL
jgi:hypothetical protein